MFILCVFRRSLHGWPQTLNIIFFFSKNPWSTWFALMTGWRQISFWFLTPTQPRGHKHKTNRLLLQLLLLGSVLKGLDGLLIRLLYLRSLLVVWNRLLLRLIYWRGALKVWDRLLLTVRYLRSVLKVWDRLLLRLVYLASGPRVWDIVVQH